MKRHHPVYDPFAPLTPKQQRRQARQYVNSQISPLLKQINADFNRQLTGQSSAISQASDLLAKQLQPQQMTTHNWYQGAIDQQKQLDEALANRLGGLGQNILAGQVGVDPSRSAALQNMSQLQSGSNFAQGSSGLAQLIADQAGAENYASQLPGFARSGGAWTINNLRNSMEQGRQKAVGELRSKIPGLVAQTGQDIANRELQKAIAAQSGLIQGQKLQAQIGYQNARINQGAQRLKQQADQFTLRENRLAAQALAQQGLTQQRINISKKQYKLAVQREARLTKSKTGKKGGYTALQIRKLRNDGIEAVKRFKNGVPPVLYKDGTVKQHGLPDHKGPNAWADAERFLILHGWPPSMARNLVGHVYGPHGPRRKGRGPSVSRGSGPRS